MRWGNLFDDLESQLEHELTAEEIDLRAEEERLRLARMSIRDRIVAIHQAEGKSASYEIRLFLAGGATISVRPVAFGRDWFSADLIDGTPRVSQCVVPLAAIAGVAFTREQVARSLSGSDSPGGDTGGTGHSAVADSGRGISARLGLGFVLRDLCRRRRALDVHLVDGVLHGTIDRVGRDHFDLAIHEPGSPRRESEVNQYRLVPLSQVLYVRM